MSHKPARPNDRDCEYLLYLIYSGERGIPFDEFPGYCEHYNRWKPEKSKLRNALGRLVARGFAIEKDGVYFAAPEIHKTFDALRNPEWGVFEEMDELAKLVVGSA